MSNFLPTLVAFGLPSGLLEQRKKPPRASNACFWGTLSNIFRRKSECAESVRISGAISLISDKFLDGPTLDPLQPAQSKRCFSILTSASEMNQKSMNCVPFLESFLCKSLILSRVDAKLLKKESKLEMCFFMFLWRSVGKVNYPHEPNMPNRSRGGV